MANGVEPKLACEAHIHRKRATQFPRTDRVVLILAGVLGILALLNDVVCTIGYGVVCY